MRVYPVWKHPLWPCTSCSGSSGFRHWRAFGAPSTGHVHQVHTHLRTGLFLVYFRSSIVREGGWCSGPTMAVTVDRRVGFPSVRPIPTSVHSGTRLPMWGPQRSPWIRGSQGHIHECWFRENLSTKPKQVDADAPAPRRLPKGPCRDTCTAGRRCTTHGRSHPAEDAVECRTWRLATSTCTCVHQERRCETPRILATCQEASFSCAADRRSSVACASHRWTG